MVVILFSSSGRMIEIVLSERGLAVCAGGAGVGILVVAWSRTLLPDVDPEAIGLAAIGVCTGGAMVGMIVSWGRTIDIVLPDGGPAAIGPAAMGPAAFGLAAAGIATGMIELGGTATGMGELGGTATGMGELGGSATGMTELSAAPAVRLLCTTASPS